MLTRPARIVVLLACFAMLAAESASATRIDSLSPDQSAPTAMVRLPGHVLGALARAKLVKPAPDAGQTPLIVTVTLRRDDQAGFDRYRHELTDKHSRNYRHFLTQTQIAARFGPSQRSYDRVLAYLRANGFELVQGSSNRLTITVRGTRAQAERAFHARIADFRIGSKTFYANQADPAMPRAIAASVMAVTGLSNYATPQPTHIAIFSAFCAVIVGYLSAMFGLDPNTAAGKACILSALAWCINWNATAAGYGQLINANLSCPPLQNLATLPLSD